MEPRPASATFLDRPIAKDFYDSATRVSAVGGALVLPLILRLASGGSRR